MRKGRALGILVVILGLLLVACQGYVTTNSSTKSYETGSGGGIEVSLGKANGTTEQSIETGSSGTTLDAEVTLAVGKGSFRIELIGPQDQVTLSLEARDGETVTGTGQMATDAFGEASYRVTAVEAENVDYVIDYTVR